MAIDQKKGFVIAVVDLELTMKIFAPQAFSTAHKPLLPFVPETIEITKKEDVSEVDLLSNRQHVFIVWMLAFLDAVTSTSHCHLLSDPADLNFTEPREVLQLCHEIEHTFIGLNNGTGNAQHQMMQQFAAGSASITCNKGVVLACDKARKAGVAIAEEALALDDRPLMAALTAAAVAALSRTDDDFSACTCPMR